MKQETIKEILIRRDDMSPEDADDCIAEAKEQLEYLISEDMLEEAYLICQDHFGLEPDYIQELL